MDVTKIRARCYQFTAVTEFYNDLFQEELATHFIKFRPIKPRSPHLNGKVERSQKTDKSEFYRNNSPKKLPIFTLGQKN